MASSAIRSRSPRVSTPPVGFAGELITIIRVRGVISEASSSTSSRKSLLHADRDRDRRAADEPGERLVDRVARVGDDDLVAGVDQGQDRVEHHALAANGDEDAVRRRPRTPAGGGVLGDRLAQRGEAGERRVVGLARVEGALGRLADVRGGVEVGLADLEVDDRSAGRLEGPGPGGDLEGGLRPDRIHPGGGVHGRIIGRPRIGRDPLLRHR